MPESTQTPVTTPAAPVVSPETGDSFELAPEETAAPGFDSGNQLTKVSSGNILRLQKTVGNQAVMRMLARQKAATATTTEIQRLGSRTPDQFNNDFVQLMNVAQPDVAALFRLLREAKNAHSASTRKVFSSKSAHAADYASIVETIQNAIVGVTDVRIPTYGKKIIINAHKMAGMGDLVLARNCATALEVDGFDCIFVSNAVDDMKKMASAYTAKIYSNEAVVPVGYRKPAAFIHVGGDAGSKDVFPRLGIPAETPLLKLLEYGFFKKTQNPSAEENLKKSFGLTKDEMGVFTDPDLGNRAKKSDNERLGELLNLKDKGLLKALVGKADPTMEDILRYKDTNDLFFGYSHTSAPLNNFLNLVLANEVKGETTKNVIDICMPSRFPTKTPEEKEALNGDIFQFDFAAGDLAIIKKKYADLQEAFDKGDSKVKNELQPKVTATKFKIQHREKVLKDRLSFLGALGIRQVQIHTKADGNRVSDPTAMLGELGYEAGNKVLRIIDFFGLDPEDYKIMLIASGKLSLATGDQSWSQAISADKTVLYEQFDHKKAFFDTWKNLAEENFPGGKMVAFLKLYDKNNNNKDLIDHDAMYDLVKDPELQDEFSAINDIIKKGKNASSIMVAAVKGFISDKHQERVDTFKQHRQATINSTLSEFFIKDSTLNTRVAAMMAHLPT